MCHAIANATNQIAQRGAHARNTLLQHPQFIAAGHTQVLAQVATGNALDHVQGFTQRASDLASDDHGGGNTEQQDQQGGDQLQSVGLCAFDVAALQLKGVKRITAAEYVGAVISHVFAHGNNGVVRIGVHL